MPATWTEIGNIKGPPGASGGDTDVVGEVPAGAINNANQNFVTASSFVANSLAVFLNGVRQKQTIDYTVTGAGTFSMIVAPVTGDLLTVDYLIPAVVGLPFYIGLKARWIALANGTRLEVQDTGGTWQKQVEYTE